MKDLSTTISKLFSTYEPNYMTILLLHTINAVLLLLPFFMDVTPEFDTSEKFLPVVKSHQYYLTQVIMLTVSVTLLTEVVLDAHCHFQLALCRLMLLFALLIPSALTLYFSYLPDRRQAQLFLSCFEMRNNLVAGASIAAMVEINSNRKSKWLLFCLSFVSMFCFEYWLWEMFMKRTSGTVVISILLNFVFLFCIVWLTWSSVSAIFRSRTITNMANISLSVEEKYTVIFSLSLTCNILAQFVTYFAYNTQSWADIHVNEVVLFCGNHIAFNALAFILTMRIEREISYIAKVNIGISCLFESRSHFLIFAADVVVCLCTHVHS